MNSDGSDHSQPTDEGVDWREAGLQWSDGQSLDFRPVQQARRSI